ncbi:hypothetical protein FD754_023520 [Muntiacus muntjak]|uniref:Homeobox domain-containing protein n=1 Tax=Muntiacus muntjak TaxID=9888 RepID=A0A5N3UTV3_MUNMU|nr:hypothetical protein FD754_023520 [Muntiacus muntjak]
MFPFCLQCSRPRFHPWVGKIPWRRKWQPTPVFLPRKSHGWRSLAGYSPWGHSQTRLSDFSFTYCFFVFAIVDSATVNTELHVSFELSSGYMPRSGIPESYDSLWNLIKSSDLCVSSQLKSAISMHMSPPPTLYPCRFNYFNENQYPDEAKREEIANACNAVIQKPGKKLSDLERVTSLKVYNWFANRRKEIKRRANIAAILESHGIDVQSPGGHSNSDDVDGNDYSEQDTWQVRNGEEEEGRSSEGGREAEKDDSTSHSDHQDPISLAVEMAAVNHTILALARQGANEIKTEALDDD